MGRRFRIAGKLAAVSLVVAVPLVIIITVVYGQWYDTRLASVVQERAGRAEQTAVAFELLVRNMLRTMDSMGQSQASLEPMSPESVAELRRVRQLYPWAYVAFTDTDGRVLASSDPAMVGADVSGDPAFREAMSGGESDGDGIEPVQRHRGGTIGFHLVTTVVDGAGRPIGAAVGLVDVTLLPDALEEVIRTGRGGVSIIDSAGQVVYQNEEPRLATSLARWGDRYPWVAEALAGEVGTTTNWRFPLDEGGRRVAVFVPIEEFEWAAGSSISRDIALAPLYRSLLIGLPLTTFVTALALAASYVLASRIRRSLVALSEDAKRIGSGNLEQEVRSGRGDEIGDVARSLEAARGSLKSEREIAAAARDEVQRERDHLEKVLAELDAAYSTTRTLLDAAGAMGNWTDLTEVLDRLADVLLKAIGHSRSWIFLWNAERREVEVAASAGTRAFPKGIRVTYEEASPSLREVISQRHSRVIDYDALEGERRGAATSFGMRYVLVVPLCHGSDLLGLIAIDDAGERREFTDVQIDLAEAIGSQASIAVENATLFAAQSERAARLGVLGEVGELVSASLEPADVVNRALDSVVRYRGVAATSLWEYDAGRSQLVLLGARGFPMMFFNDYAEGVNVDQPYDIARAVRGGVPVVHEDARHSDVARNVLVAYRRYAIELGALVVIPLTSQGTVIGALTEAWLEPRRFASDDIAFATSLANTIATALLNARLHAQTREAARLGAALNDVEDVVHSTLRPEEMFDRMLETAGKGLGCDSAALDLLENGIWVPRYLWRLPDSFLGHGVSPNEMPFVEIAASTRRPVAVDDAYNDPRAVRELQEEWGVRSVLVVPLALRDERVGAIFFNHHEPHKFTEGEVDFARKVATSVSLALENARLFQNEHFVADTLQETLLALPDQIEGFDFAHVYRSASESARVGGDFYDVFDLEPDCVGVMVGDISGKGVEAAMLTALVKNTLRAQSTSGERSPAAVMNVVNSVMLKWSSAEIFTTVFFGLYDRRSGELTYCNAGHTASVILRADTARDIEVLEANSPLVGALPELEFRDSTTTLTDGDVLFMYTDGLTEARGAYGGLYEETRLFGLLARLRGKHADALVVDVRDAVLAFGGGRLSDDLAILALERHDDRR